MGGVGNRMGSKRKTITSWLDSGFDWTHHGDISPCKYNSPWKHLHHPGNCTGRRSKHIMPRAEFSCQWSEKGMWRLKKFEIKLLHTHSPRLNSWVFLNPWLVSQWLVCWPQPCRHPDHSQVSSHSVIFEGSDEKGFSGGEEDPQSITWAFQLLLTQAPGRVHPLGFHHTTQDHRFSYSWSPKREEKKKKKGKEW